MNNEEETKALFVSTRGLAKICDMHPDWDLYGNMSYPNFKINITPGTTIYLHFDMIEQFINNFLPLIINPFILVSGNSDHSTPTDFPSAEKLLNSDKLIIWFSQNMIGEHPKLKHIPIGIDYHTLSVGRGNHEWTNLQRPITPVNQELSFREIRNKMLPLKDCRKIASTNFHLCMGPPLKRTLIRTRVYEQIKNKNCILWLGKTTREEFWESLKDVAFCISPRGNGEDCHRTWEILCLGRIPIIEKSPLNKVYEGLPIVEIEDWSKLNELWLTQKLNDILFRLHDKEYNLERVLLSYWKNLINSYKKAVE